MTENVMRIALLADGSSDRALMPILAWLLRRCEPTIRLAEPGFRARVAREPLTAEIEATRILFRPNILFVHRDAETQDPDLRRREIPDGGRVVKVVPVRMTEAWLLFDEAAIRTAADRPASRVPLDLPSVSRLETIADPKDRLHDALLTAAEVGGRQAQALPTGPCPQRAARRRTRRGLRAAVASACFRTPRSRLHGRGALLAAGVICTDRPTCAGAGGSA